MKNLNVPHFQMALVDICSVCYYIYRANICICKHNV